MEVGTEGQLQKLRSTTGKCRNHFCNLREGLYVVGSFEASSRMHFWCLRGTVAKLAPQQLSLRELILITGWQLHAAV